MKTIVISKSRWFAVLLLFALLSITYSCKKSSSTPSGNSVSIVNMSFSPGTITVAINSTVTWTNNDGVAHTVTSTTPGLFDSGSLASGKTFSYTFSVAGTYAYKCSFHSSMLGTIIVNPAPSGSGGYGSGYGY
jgi:plastocyanin